LSQGGNIFVMTDDDQRKQLANYFVSKGIQDRFIFVGLAKNLFYWMDETGGTEMTLNYFGPQQPQPTDGKSQLKCAYMDPKQQHNWFAASCATNFSYICQYKKPPVLPTSPTIATTTTRNIQTQTQPPITTTRPVSVVTGTPDTAPVSSYNLALPAWAIALLALLGLLLLLLLLFCCIWCLCCRKRDKKKVQVLLDVRPKAPIPQSGTVGKMDINDTFSVNNQSEYIVTTNHV